MEHDYVKRAQDGDKKAFEQLYKHYYGYAMGIALRYANVKEEAGEIVNDSFMKVFDKLDTYAPQQSFKAWLRRIVINTSIDYYRRSIKYFAVMDIEKAHSETLDPGVLDALSVEDLMQLLRGLPELLRIVFNMYEIEGYSHNEIADTLEIPSSSSRTYLARAKQKLREKVLQLNAEKNEGAVR
ncbi:RNA polymerase sigma factor [Nitritalea halalkaliphila]|uniref:RNA polymerase sigma factor n=1 Tax=Nitritalea halalkaliphila TaxID=590849 RepID=UPI0002E97EE6|nr:RNA polymerase sigma factor [Nitritalea halalkaliphila]